MSTESYATQYISLVDLLRRDQGNCVTIMRDSSSGEDDCKCSVEVFAAWTNWMPQRFYGDTVLAALWSAYKAAREKA